VHLSRLVDGLRAAGDDVELFTAGGERTGLGKVRDLWDPAARRALDKVADRFEPDVVHFHNVARELSASVLGAGRGVAKAMTFHDHHLLGSPDVARLPAPRAAVIRVWCAVNRRIARRHLDAAIAVSAETARLLEHHGFRGVSEQPLFAPVPQEPTTAAGACTSILFAGRLAPDKGATLLGQAFEAIATDHPELRLVYAGDGPDRDALERLARRWVGRVELAGRVPEARMHALMAEARVVVAPSIQRIRAETGPQTVLEAALFARPVITAEDLPMAALVRASGGGMLMHPEDADDLAQALEVYARDPAAATTAGMAAREYAIAHHTPEVAVPRLRALYERLASGAAAPRS
jgi:glycosyltransferase involved in cell wall biosynthesis